jgi:DNA-binding NarL/FixJ family response regulator
MKQIRIVLVDDQNLVREGLRSLLELNSSIAVVAEAEDGETVVALLQQWQPDILLLDIRMPKVSGLEVLRQMQQQKISTPALILTTFDDHDLVLECIQLGAKGYLRKDVRFAALMQAIKSIVDGQTWYQPAVTCQIEHHPLQHSSTGGCVGPPLTAIEIQVLRLIAAGYSNHEIAAALFKSSGTVRNQVSSILTKLDVRDRTRAVLKALDLKLI